MSIIKEKETIDDILFWGQLKDKIISDNYYSYVLGKSSIHDENTWNTFLLHTRKMLEELEEIRQEKRLIVKAGSE